MAAKKNQGGARASGRAGRGRNTQADSDGYSEEDSGSEEDAKGGEKDSMMTWVACDKCEKWRRIKVDDLKSLPKRWFCKFNPDVRFNDCSIEAEEEEDPDQRLRAHLHLWVKADNRSDCGARRRGLCRQHDTAATRGSNARH